MGQGDVFIKEGEGSMGTPKKCVKCGKEFDAIRWWQKYCGRDCQYKAWIAKNPRKNVEERKQAWLTKEENNEEGKGKQVAEKG